MQIKGDSKWATGRWQDGKKKKTSCKPHLCSAEINGQSAELPANHRCSVKVALPAPPLFPSSHKALCIM